MIFNIGAVRREKAYVKEVVDSKIYKNGFETLIPQIKVAELVRSHFANSKSDKKKKALLIGFDGARADGLVGVISNDLQNNYSGIANIMKEGGLYLAFTGGTGTDLQNTSTTQGWAATLTGFWSVDNGVINMETLEKKETVLLELAKKGLSAYFVARWDEHFTHTYSAELAKSKDLNLPLQFCGRGSKTDAELHEITLNILKDEKTDIIFNIYEEPDYTGHSSKFGNDNPLYIKAIAQCDKYAYQLIETVKSRKTYQDEDWLIIISSDHGGHSWRHGLQTIQDRTIFIASNKKID